MRNYESVSHNCMSQFRKKLIYLYSNKHIIPKGNLKKNLDVSKGKACFSSKTSVFSGYAIISHEMLICTQYALRKYMKLIFITNQKNII